MPSTYSPNLRFELIGTGEQAGAWGNSTNNNIGTLIEQAICGLASVTMGDANYTLTTNSGAADQARNMILNVTSSVPLTQTRSILCPAFSKLYVVSNSTTGGQSLTVTTGLAGSSVTIPSGHTVTVFCDGTNVTPATTYAPTITTAAISLPGDLTFSGVARRIRGDFSGATLASRVNFQTTESNAGTAIAAIPNGTPNPASPTNFTAFNAADPANAAYVTIGAVTSSAYIGTSVTGAAAHIPVDLVSGGGLSARLPTTGGMLVGTTSPTGDLANAKAVVAGAFTTQSGTTSVPHNTSTNLVQLPTTLSHGAYLGFASAAVSDVDNYSVATSFFVQGTSCKSISLATAPYMLLSVDTATSNVRVTQSSGGTLTIYWSLIRLL